VYLHTADALSTLWRFDDVFTARDEAMALYQRVLDQRPRSRHALRGFAEVAEAAGHERDALDAWRSLLAAAERGSPDWFELRFRHASLLARVDRERARNVMAQHATLYPEFGPQPWGDRLREVAEELGVEP
jgi:tetratricopeptide (TPR) repeat protein